MHHGGGNHDILSEFEEWRDGPYAEARDSEAWNGSGNLPPSRHSRAVLILLPHHDLERRHSSTKRRFSRSAYDAWSAADTSPAVVMMSAQMFAQDHSYE